MTSASSKKTLGERIIHASFLVAAAHILLKFAGLIQVKFATQYLDTSLYETIMVVAFTGVLNSLFLIGEEVIGPSFLTLFMQEKEEEGEKKAWDYANSLMSLQSVLLLIAVCTIVCFPDFYIRLFTSWTSEKNASQYFLLRRSLQILAPSLYFLSMGSTTYVLLNGYKKFFLAAFGDASTKICIVLGLILGVHYLGLNERGLFFGILTGSVAKVLTHLWGLRGQLHFFRFSFHWKSPVMRAMFLLMLPLIAGILFAKVRDVFNNIYILTRINQSGILMANDLGRKLFSSIQWMVPYALQIALFPFLCELVSKKDRAGLGKVLETSCRMLIAVFLPMSFCLVALAKPIAVFIFAGGKTGVEIAALAGLSTGCYTLVLPAAAVECVLMQGYFADKRTVAVTLIGIFSSILSVLISFVFIVYLKVDAVQALLAVSLGFVFSRIIKSCILACYLKRNIELFAGKKTFLFLLKCFLVASLSGLVTWGVSQGMTVLMPDGIARSLQAGVMSISRLRILLRLTVSGLAGAGVFLLGAKGMGIEEVYQGIQWGVEKLARRKEKK